MDIDKEIRKQAIKNAFEHKGNADIGAVVSKIMGQFPEYRKNAKELITRIKPIVQDINGLSEEALDSIVSTEYPEFLVREKKVQVHSLPELRNVKGKVVMRMAPSPSGPLHIGHSRMAILNDEYVKRYGGDLILRIEDTNPSNIDPIAYEQIPEDLKWLEVNVTKTVIQSDRMGLYYNEAKTLLANGYAYICTCTSDQFKAGLMHSVACPHRNSAPETNLDQFQGILDGKFKPGEAVLIIKTDLAHPNPALRDWIAFRISEVPHPRHGRDFRFYPMMNFSVAVDDRLLGLTHVIRGKDHINNTEKQKYIFKYNKWKLPEYYHYGLVDFPNVILKTSIIKKGISNGTYSGWDDIRLGTLLAFRKRGFSPGTFRRYWVESGMREVDSEFSLEIFYSMNKELIDMNTRRLFFIPDPVRIHISDAPPTKVSVPYHPTNSSLGTRKYSLPKDPEVFVPGGDWKATEDGHILRLKDMCNLEKKGELGIFRGASLMDRKMKIIQWSPADGLDFTVYKPDGTSDTGKIEPFAKDFRGVAQLERYGYVNVASSHVGYFTHK